MLHSIDHVAVAVHRLDEALPVWRDLLGFELHGIEEVPDQKVRVAVLRKGGDTVELLEPAAPDSPITGFLARRGPGLHHLCLAVSGLEAVLDRLAAAGVPLIDRDPRPGAEGRQVAFVHPRGAGGVLIELSERPPARTSPEPPTAAG
jgi:methylmalonyl-CoA/ethylmalonyl-CoA epimerase